MISPLKCGSFRSWVSDCFQGNVFSFKKPVLSSYCSSSIEPSQSIKEESFVSKNVDLLSIEPEQKQMIQSLLQRLAEDSLVHLFRDSSELKDIGGFLKEKVHPCRFLLEIFSDPSSLNHLKKIYENRSFFTGRSQVWGDFVQNLGINFQDRQKDLYPYLDSFAEKMRADVVFLRKCVDEGKWQKFLEHLIVNC